MITAQLATIPGREQSVRMTIESLLPQVDWVFVTCNDYLIKDAFELALSIRSHKLYTTSTFKNENKGDAEKFRHVESYEGYILTCDDDLIYPPDYATKMIEAVDKYNGEAIVSLHGRELMKGQIGSYYSSKYRLRPFHCLNELDADHIIENGTIGTGVMAWNADKVKVSYEWFETKNMADIWLAVNARKNNIPLIVAAHPADWLKVGYDGPDTIWHKSYNNDSFQTGIWNKYQNNG